MTSSCRRHARRESYCIRPHCPGLSASATSGRPPTPGWMLAGARQKWWQVLPLGPTGYGDSPYQCFSAFAGNPLLVSPELLVQDGLLDSRDVAAPAFPAERVDYGPVIAFKNHLLAKCWENFRAGRAAGLKQPFEEFLHEQRQWLDDYALFMAIKDAHGGSSWHDWPCRAAPAQAGALARCKQELANGYRAASVPPVSLFPPVAEFAQPRQEPKSRHHRRHADFRLGRLCRRLGQSRVVPAGRTAPAEGGGRGAAGLFQRHRPTLGQSAVRLGRHQASRITPGGSIACAPPCCWSIWSGSIIFAASRPTGKFPRAGPTPSTANGSRPRETTCSRVQQKLGGLPLIAEDLGIITPEVEALRDRFHLPGMRVLQFAFGDGPGNPYLPHNYVRNTVVYTGTHDNDTTRGWFASVSEKERDHVRRYLGRDGSDIAWDLIRLAWSSAADYAIAPLQDILNLGTEARMNLPGQPAGNWSWRYQAHQLTAAHLGRLAEMTSIYGR